MSQTSAENPCYWVTSAPARCILFKQQSTQTLTLFAVCIDGVGKMMSGTGQKATEKSVTQRYEALLRVSQTLISIRSSEELFGILARELRAVVSFYVMGVGIYDKRAHEVRLTSYGEPGDPLEVPKFAPE